MSHLTKRVVWIIDSEQWPRASLRAELIERSFDTDGFVNIRDAIKEFHNPLSANPQIIVLELCNLESGYNELESVVSLGIPIIALGGAKEFNQKIIHRLKWAKMMKRPFSIGTVADAVEKMMRKH